jgi:hypothetical protein
VALEIRRASRGWCVWLVVVWPFSSANHHGWQSNEKKERKKSTNFIMDINSFFPAKKIQKQNKHFDI